MSYAIQINFQRALQQAQKLESLAAKLRTMSSEKYAGTLQQLSNDWRSDSASQFLSKGEKLQDEINETADALESAASNVRSTARRIYEAEKRAEEIAKARAAKR